MSEDQKNKRNRAMLHKIKTLGLAFLTTFCAPSGSAYAAEQNSDAKKNLTEIKAKSSAQEKDILPGKIVAVREVDSYADRCANNSSWCHLIAQDQNGNFYVVSKNLSDDSEKSTEVHPLPEKFIEGLPDELKNQLKKNSPQINVQQKENSFVACRYEIKSLKMSKDGTSASMTISSGHEEFVFNVPVTDKQEKDSMIKPSFVQGEKQEKKDNKKKAPKLGEALTPEEIKVRSIISSQKSRKG